MDLLPSNVRWLGSPQGWIWRGALEGAAPNVHRIILNLSTNILMIGGKILGAKRPKFGAGGTVLENLAIFEI